MRAPRQAAAPARAAAPAARSYAPANNYDDSDMGAPPGKVRGGDETTSRSDTGLGHDRQVIDGEVRNPSAARQARQRQTGPRRGRAVPRQAGRPRRGPPRLLAQLPVAARLGMVPTEHNLRLLERYKIKVRQAREARLADLKALGEQISKMPGITIEANVNHRGPPLRLGRRGRRSPRGCARRTCPSIPRWSAWKAATSRRPACSRCP